MPPRSIASCVCVNSTCPDELALKTADEKVPCSKRLYQIANPSESQKRSFNRFLLLLVKRKRCPESGSPPSVCVTIAESPLKLFLISVGSVQTKIRTFVFKLNIDATPVHPGSSPVLPVLPLPEHEE